MVVPLGAENEQQLCLVTKDAGGRLDTKALLQVSFSPFIVSH